MKRPTVQTPCYACGGNGMILMGQTMHGDISMQCAECDGRGMFVREMDDTEAIDFILGRMENAPDNASIPDNARIVYKDIDGWHVAAHDGSNAKRFESIFQVTAHLAEVGIGAGR